MRGRVRHWLAVTLALVVFVLAVAPAQSAPRPGETDDAADPVTRLAQQYAPFLYLKHQAEPCGAGEPYAPLPVQQILDQPDVKLLDRDGKLITDAPSADDLAAAPQGSNIDLPGDAGHPGCDFEQRFGRRTATLPVTQYVRVATDPERPGQFALQFWWWFVYNDWNDLHEGDWEMSQVVFGVATPEEALDATPVSMALSQHNGTEVHPWSKVPLREGRPVVHIAVGSHAAYYSAHRWFGTDGTAGFGCDDTRSPSDLIDPAVVVMPDVVTPGDGFGWMVFQGHWGQRLPGLNDSETGPQTTEQWQNPITWMEAKGRSAAVKTPEVGLVTNFFCVASAEGSDVLNQLLNRPLVVLLALFAVLGLFVLLVRRTRWSPVVLRPLVRSRRAGQILRTAWRIVRTHHRLYRPIGLMVFVGGIAAGLLQFVLIEWSPFHTLLDVVGRETTVGHALALITGLAITVPVAVVALAWTVIVTETRDSMSGPAPTVGRRLRNSGILLPCAVLFASVMLGSLFFPLGLYLVARWFAAPAAAANGSAGGRAALRESARLTKGHRWRTLGIAFASITLLVLLGALVGTFTLILTGASFGFVNLVAGLVNAVVLPWLGVVVVLVHGDLRARQAEPITARA